MSVKKNVEFEGFDEVIARLYKLDGNVGKTAEKALKKTHEIITQKAEKAIEPHNQTHQTEKSLYRNAEIEWEGMTAVVRTGFSVRAGGLAAIFLMYGTQAHSVSNQYGRNVGVEAEHKKDPKMYNAFFGASTRKEVAEAQKEIFYNEIRRLNG